MKLFSLVTAYAVASALVALPTALAFYTNCRHHDVSSRTTRKESPISILFVRKERGGYSSMPPLSNSTLSHGNIVKVFKRDIHPTVDLPYENNYDMIDHYFMGMALQQAQYAWDTGEVPIGALVVREHTHEDASNQTKRTFQIVAAAHNKVETNIDASAHAELMALRNGARNLQNWRFPPNSRLYTTLEPCPMCLASIQAFRIDHIVYGAPDNRLGAIKTHMDLLNVSKHPYHEVKSVTGGVREEECGDIMVQFFRERRRKKKEMKGGRKKLLKLPLQRRPREIKKKQPRLISFVKSLLRRE